MHQLYCDICFIAVVWHRTCDISNVFLHCTASSIRKSQNFWCPFLIGTVKSANNVVNKEIQDDSDGQRFASRTTRPMEEEKNLITWITTPSELNLGHYQPTDKKPSSERLSDLPQPSAQICLDSSWAALRALSQGSHQSPIGGGQAPTLTPASETGFLLYHGPPFSPPAAVTQCSPATRHSHHLINAVKTDPSGKRTMTKS